MEDNKIKPIAIHLPQFHPIPENDEWWGKGFTEWTNVTKAKPLFEGHYQPHLPADLGFYDLRLEEARIAQEKLAKEYGIFGFCYYHYWFNGKRMLQEPVDRKLKNLKEDIPFMLCWANENWTRAWDGHDKKVLLNQEYSEEDDIAHMTFLCDTIFKDSRYIRINNKPVFLIYRPTLFPNINKTIELWRNIARKKGVGELHLGYMQSWGVKIAPAEMGFDFAVEFQPDFSLIPPTKKSVFVRGLKKIGIKIKDRKTRYRSFKYEEFVELNFNKRFNSEVSPAITPMWDNSSRRSSNAFIFLENSPEIFKKWLKYIVQNFPWKKNEEKFLFINAWNEWAEGNHIEPCQKWGLSYLEAMKETLDFYGEE